MYRWIEKGESVLTVNHAVAKRIAKLLDKKNMSQYRLEQETEIQHGSMQCIMNGRNKTVTLSTIILIAKVFGMPLTEFLDDELFDPDNLDIEQKTAVLRQTQKTKTLC